MFGHIYLHSGADKRVSRVGALANGVWVVALRKGFLVIGWRLWAGKRSWTTDNDHEEILDCR